jgi:hypothetical protein
MWTEVVFKGANASNGIAMAHELRSAGLTLDKDFTWQYIPEGMVTFNNTFTLSSYTEESSYTEDYHEAQLQKKQVIIQFRDPALATFYSLKWQR